MGEIIISAGLICECHGKSVGKALVQSLWTWVWASRVGKESRYCLVIEEGFQTTKNGAYLFFTDSIFEFQNHDVDKLRHYTELFFLQQILEAWMYERVNTIIDSYTLSLSYLLFIGIPAYRCCTAGVYLYSRVASRIAIQMLQRAGTYTHACTCVSSCSFVLSGREQSSFRSEF